jgi:hypothetical protein
LNFLFFWSVVKDNLRKAITPFKTDHDPIGIVDRGKGSPQIYTNHRKEGFRAITDKTIIKSSWNTCGYDVLLATIEVEIRFLQLAHPKN